MALPTTRRELLAEIISTLAHPALLVTGTMGVITYRYAESPDQFWRWWLIGTFLLVGPATLLTGYRWFISGKLDVDISRRQDRVLPLMLACLGALFGSYLIALRLESPNLLLLSYILVALLVSLTIITVMWKISFHASTLMALVTLLVIFSGPEFAWFYLLIIPVAWARLLLAEHTKAQLIGGSLIGVGMTTVAALLFRG